MVSPLSLCVFAAALLCLAALMARHRRRNPRAALTEGRNALFGSSLFLTISVVLFAASWPLEVSETWRTVGSLALLTSPLGATLALWFQGDRRSIARALTASTIALTGVLLWLTLNLRGPRGDWSLIDIALVLPAAAIAIASAACLGRWSKRTAVSVLLLAAVSAAGCRNSPSDGGFGTLELTIRDTTTGESTPARVELLDAQGRAVVPEDALKVFSDCGNLPVHPWVPGSAAIQAVWNGHREILNPYTGTNQFYIDGSVRARLPAGSYSVRATKGIEFKRATDTILVEPDQVTHVQLDLVRWIDLAREGWYGADDHIHIPRPHPRFDPRVATWIEAEGLHFANLLQMGLARDVHITPQHGFGPRSVYWSDNTLLMSGQENPRTHVLGHSIVLGARQYIDVPSDYLLYDEVWELAHRQGAVNGYAHWGLAGAEEGLALWGHTGLLDFVEVLNLGFPFYDRWYEALDLGISLGPTAGSDYPCLPGLPGRERFYARLDGSLEPQRWLAAVRSGATFVTNGPAIELSVSEAQPGEVLRLTEPGPVSIRGRVRFDPERDEITGLELIHSGAVALRTDVPTAVGEIELQTTLVIDQTSWLALRASGVKRGETEIDLQEMFYSMLVLERRSNAQLLSAIPEGLARRPSAAHTGAVLVTVEGTPPLAEQSRGREVARLWLARLDELEPRLNDRQAKDWARFPGRGDGVDLSTARANRVALLKAIEAARQHHSANRP